MNEHDQERIKQLLQEALPPMGTSRQHDLSRDLWPSMLKRLEADSTRVPWFDWALLAAVAACLAMFQEAIPILFYYL